MGNNSTKNVGLFQDFNGENEQTVYSYYPTTAHIVLFLEDQYWGFFGDYVQGCGGGGEKEKRGNSMSSVQTTLFTFSKPLAKLISQHLTHHWVYKHLNSPLGCN